MALGLPSILENPLNKIPGVGAVIETDDEKRRREQRQRDWERRHPKAPKGLHEDFQKAIDEAGKPKKKSSLFGIPLIHAGDVAPLKTLVGGIFTGDTLPKLISDTQRPLKAIGAPTIVQRVPAQIGEMSAGFLPAAKFIGDAIWEDASHPKPIWKRDANDFKELAKWTYEDVMRGHDKKHALPQTGEHLGNVVASMLGSWGRSVAKIDPVPLNPLDWNDPGEWGHQFNESWDYVQQNPVQALLDILPIFGAIGRVGSATRLGTSIGRLNPELGGLAAAKAGIKESYRPGSAARAGLEGGIGPRVHRVQLGDVVKEVQGRPWSQNTVGRGLQRGYDRLFFTQGAKERRVAAVEERAAREAQRRTQLETTELSKPIAQAVYGRAGNLVNSFARRNNMTAAQGRRATALSYAFQMPQHMEPVAALKAVQDDLRNILERGTFEAVPKGKRKLKEIPLEQSEKQSLVAEVADLEKVIGELRTGKIDPDEFQAALEAMKEIADRNHDMGLEIMQRRYNLDDDQMESLAATWADRSQILPKRLASRGILGLELGQSPERIARFEHYLDNGMSEDEALARVATMDAMARGIRPNDPASFYRDRIGMPSGESAQEFVDRARTEGIRAQYQVPFSLERKVSPELAEENLRYVEGGDLYKPHLGRQKNEKVFRTINGQRVQIIGRITPKEWIKRVVAVVPDVAERTALARWYEQVAPTFERFFGEDAEAILRGFTVSQANASPTSGLQATLRVFDKLKTGQAIDPLEISAVVKSIEKAVEGQHVSKGLAAKLHDFADSIEGKNTRTWMGDDPRGGRPTANDVHAIRDLGYVDKKLAARLRNPEPKALFRKGIDDFQVDSGGSPGTHQYERMREQYEEITDYLNQPDVAFDGRTDWKPAEVQALGWSAIQRVHGAYPENLLDAVANNTRRINLEVTKGASGIGDDLTPAEAAVAARHVEQVVSDMVEETDGLYLDSHVQTGVSGFGGSVNASLHFNVIGSPERTQALIDRLGNAFDQMDVWATRTSSSTGSKPTLHIYADELGDPDAAAALYNELRATDKKKFTGFATIEGPDGTPGISLVMPGKAVTEAELDAFEAAHRGLLDDAVTRSLGDVEYNYGAGNTQILSSKKGLKKRGKGEVLRTDPAQSGRPLDDPLAAEARGRLEQAVEHARSARDEAPLTAQRAHYQRPHWKDLPRGATEMLDEAGTRTRIHEFEGADPTTLGHELWHSSYHDLDAADKSTLNAHYAGGRKFDDWADPEHEQFAIDGEKFLKRGRAPVRALQPIFTKMSKWVKAVWKEERRRGGTPDKQLPPEVEDVFRRMFAEPEHGMETWGYFPHRDIHEIARQEYQGGVRPPARGAVIGKPQLTGQTVARQGNEMIRYQTGQLAHDPSFLVDVYLRRLRFKETLEARDDLFSVGRSMSEKPPKNAWLVRDPDATPVRVEEKAQAAVRGRPTTRDTETSSLEELEGRLAAGADDVRREMIAKPGEHPDWSIGDANQENIRWVPDEYVRRRFGDVFESGPRSSLESGLALMTSLQRTTGIYGRPVAYVAGNIPFNTMALLASQPLSTLRNAALAFKIARERPALWRKMISESGETRASGGLPDRYLEGQNRLQRAEQGATKFQRGMADMLSKVADNPFRGIAFLNSAGKRGAHTMDEVEKLIDDAGPDLSDVRQEMRDRMLDFDALNPSQRRLAGSLLYLWPFIYASLKWPAMFAREYPLRTALMSNTSSEIGKEQDLPQEIANLWKKYGIDVSTANPLGPLGDIAQTSRTFFNDPLKMDLSILNDRITPTLAALVEGMSGGKKNALVNLIRQTIPGASEYFSKDPEFRGGKVYGDRSMASYLLQRHLRFYPRGVNPEVVKERVEQFHSDMLNADTHELARDDDWKKIVTRYNAVGGDAGEIRRSYKSWWDYQEAVDEKKSSTGQHKLTSKQTIEILDEIVRENYPEYANQLWDISRMDDDYQKAHAKALDDYAEALKKLINSGRDQLSSDWSNYGPNGRAATVPGGAGGGVGGAGY